jgi:hypothetical protein
MVGCYAGARIYFRKWAIGLRLHNINEADIDQAFNNADILRTHLLATHLAFRNSGRHPLVTGAYCSVTSFQHRII